MLFSTFKRCVKQRLFGGGCHKPRLHPSLISLPFLWQNINWKSRDFKRLESLKCVRVILEVATFSSRELIYLQALRLRQ